MTPQLKKDVELVLSTLLSCEKARTQVQAVLTAAGFEGEGFVRRVVESLTPPTLPEFRASRRFRHSIGEAIGDSSLDDATGFTYLEDKFFIEITKHPNQKARFETALGLNDRGFADDDLIVVESRLHEWVKETW